jgi:heptosyltransferase-2
MSPIPTKILIVGPAWIGDMMMAQTLFSIIKARSSETQIDVLASTWTLPLLARMPEVDNTIEMPLGHGKIGLGVRYRLGQFLAKEGYQQAILLPNTFKSALIPAFAGIPLRTGWRGEMRYGLLNDIRLLDERRYPRMVQRYAALGYPAHTVLPESLPYPKLVIDPARQPQLLTKFQLQQTRPLLILCPGAEYGPAKRWPENYYAEVAAQKIAEGWQVWLLGSAKDQPVAENIRDQLDDAQQAHCYNLAGVTQLDEAIDLMALADAVVTNDSGLMHIAAALQLPLVVIYGSTSPAFTPPLAEQVKIVSIPVDCGPCFERECPQRHHKCLRDLRPALVSSALNELLRENNSMLRSKE